MFNGIQNHPGGRWYGGTGARRIQIWERCAGRCVELGISEAFLDLRTFGVRDPSVVEYWM